MTSPPIRCGAVIGVLLVALAAGCDRGDADEPEDAARPSPTPTVAEPPSPEPTDDPAEDPAPEAGEPPPELHLIGDDYERVVRSYMAFRTWLFRNPDPELFDEITHPDCECYIQKDLLASYADQGLRWTGDEQGIVVRNVEVVDDIAQNLVHLQAVLERPGSGELVDADGNVQDRTEPREPWVEDLIFVRESPDSPWLLRDFTDRGPVEE